MAGKKKPPRPLGENATSKRPAASTKKDRTQPATGETTTSAPNTDEHLRQRLDSALGAAAVPDTAAQEGTAVDLRTRLEAALGPGEDPAADVEPVGSPSSRAHVVMLVSGLLLIGVLGVALIRSVGQGPDPPARLSTTSAQPAAPVPVRAGSSYVVTEVLPNGSVSVSHWVRPRTPAYELTLSSPDVPGGGSVWASRVRVDVDGTAIPGPTSIAARPHTYVLPGGRQILVTYRMSGAVETSPSVEGRALVRVASLDLSVTDVRTRTQAVQGVEILSLACTANTERAVPEPCGEMIGERWEVRLTGPDLDDHVMAQVDLD